jgi:hypothetical protein
MSLLSVFAMPIQAMKFDYSLLSKKAKLEITFEKISEILQKV